MLQIGLCCKVKFISPFACFKSSRSGKRFLSKEHDFATDHSYGNSMKFHSAVSHSQHIQQLVQHIQHNRAEGKFLHNTQHAQRPTLPPRFCFQRFAAVRFAYPTLKSDVWPYPIKLGIWPYIENFTHWAGVFFSRWLAFGPFHLQVVGGWVRERFGGGCPLLNQNGREGTHDHPPTQAHYTCYYSHCMFIPTLNMHSVPPPSEILFSKICCCQICSPNTLVGCLALPNQVGYLTLILKTSPTEWEVFFSKWLAFGPFHLHLLFWRRRRIWGGVISCTWVASRAYLAALWPARSQPQSVFHPAGGFEKIQATYYARQTECCECPTPESVYLQDQLRLTDPQICVPRPHVCENLDMFLQCGSLFCKLIVLFDEIVDFRCGLHHTWFVSELNKLSGACLSMPWVHSQ